MVRRVIKESREGSFSTDVSSATLYTVNESADISLQIIQTATFSSSFMNDRAYLTLDNQTYAKIGKNKWEHIPNNPHAWGGTYTDKEVYELVKKAKSVKLTESVESQEVALIEESYSSDKDFEDFKKRCQANPVYKKAAAIANKYGYRLPPLCYVEVTKSGKKFVKFNVVAIDRESYHPEINISSEFGEDPEFKIQTTAYGAMNLNEHSKFIKSVNDAHEMVSELSKLDLTTLEATEMEDY